MMKAFSNRKCISEECLTGQETAEQNDHNAQELHKVRRLVPKCCQPDGPEHPR